MKQLAQASGEPYHRVRDTMYGKSAAPAVVKALADALNVPIKEIWE